jgi:CheY-like chemotaxis protein
MDRQIQQMSRLVEDLLDIARISRGKIELRKERIALATVIEDAVETTRPLMEAQGHELILEIQREPIVLQADPTRIAQVMSNLMSNAAKYTRPGGRIWVTAREDNGEAVIAVRDTGIGIPEGMLARIFDMFTQVEHSMEGARSGLGIGLTLVQRLVEMHGGTIRVTSPGRDQGSLFVVRLPLAGQVVRPARSSGSEEAAKPTTGHRVLVVDDNRDGAESLGLLLRRIGHEVRIEHDGPSAIEAAEQFDPRVVLLDIGLPKMNGYEVAARMRERLGGAVILVAVTGWGQPEDRRRTREAGFDHHMTKPVDFAALKKLLASLG